MPKLSDTAKQLLIMAMKAEQGQQIERTNDHPAWLYEQFTIETGKGDLCYEEKPNTAQQAAQARAAIDELLDAKLIEKVVSGPEDKKRQRFRITVKGVAVYDKLLRPTQWVGRGDTWHKS